MADLRVATVDIRDPGTPPIDLVVEVKVALIETGLLTLSEPDEADIDHTAEEISKVFHERIWSMQDKAESHERLSAEAWRTVRALKSAIRAYAETRIAECQRQETKFGAAWEHREKHTQGPPQALVEAWTERRALQAVLELIDATSAALRVGEERPR